MGWDEIEGILRHVLTSLGGALVAQGVISNGQLTDVVGAICVLGGVGWSLWQKRKQRQQVVTAAATGVVPAQAKPA
jgi:hypothetical protein